MVPAIALGGLLASLLMAPATPARALAGGILPPPETITVDLVTVNGTGCPTVSVSVAPDNSGFVLNYSDFGYPASPSPGPSASPDNCQIALQIHAPAGTGYEIPAVTHRGYAYLGSGDSAVLRDTSYFQGTMNPPSVRYQLSGPLDDHWTAELPYVAPLGMRCRDPLRYLNIGLQLQLTDGPPPAGAASAGPPAVSLTSSFYPLSWLPCVAAS